MEKETINSYDKELFDRIAAKKASLEEVENSLGKLTQLMYLYYGKPVILLLDEYDVPLAKASEKGYYAPMLDVVKGLLQASLPGQATWWNPTGNMGRGAAILW